MVSCFFNLVIYKLDYVDKCIFENILLKRVIVVVNVKWIGGYFGYKFKDI